MTSLSVFSWFGEGDDFGHSAGKKFGEKTLGQFRGWGSERGVCVRAILIRKQIPRTHQKTVLLGMTLHFYFELSADFNFEFSSGGLG
jgi:hypothetical protein